MNSRITWLAVAFWGLLIFSSAGCSNFDREWREAGEHQRSGIDGRWQGSWKSEQDGHTGALLCVMSQSGETAYNAYFNATYAGIFHFAYNAKLTGRRAGDLVQLTGEQDLGWPVGVYHYEGSASPTQFYCAYRSRDDHGYFALARSGDTPPRQQLTAGTKK